MSIILMDPDIEIKVKGERFITLNNGDVECQGCDQQAYVLKCIAQALKMVAFETARRQNAGNKVLDFNGKVKI